MRALVGGPGVAGVALASGCSSAGLTTCDVCRTTAVANVFVKDSTNQPVPSLLVGVRAYLVQCGTGYLGGEGGLATDSSGYRRILMSSLYSPQTAGCVTITITTNASPSQTIGSWEFATSVQFRADDGTPRDSVRFDVIVPRR